MTKEKISRFIHGLETLIARTDWLPNWLKSTAIQQGIITILPAMLCLVLTASISFLYVEYEIGFQNEQIVENTIKLVEGTSFDIDDDPVEDDYILSALAISFIVSGILVAGFSTAVVISMTKANKRRIERLEQVLSDVAEGKLSARTGETYKVNDLARIEVAVDEMLARLEGSVTAMSDISSNIAHELKTPITRLQHNLINLKDNAELLDVEESRLFDKELDAAISESSRLASIFDALLRISQIESGARRSRFSNLDVNEILFTIADIYVDVAEDAHMTLLVEKNDKPILIQGDRELLIQQIANLIENALRYCPEKSQIKLSCALVDDQAVLQVSDNGPGIIDAEKDRVFERLYRIDKSRTDQGLGLGLSFAKAIAKLHHGSIELKDNNPGLSIRISMPLSKAQI